MALPLHNNENYHHNMQLLINRAEELKKKIIKTKHTEFSEVEIIAMEMEKSNLSDEYEIILDKLSQETVMSDTLQVCKVQLELMMSFISCEWNDILLIKKRHDIIEDLLELRKRLYALTGTDTSTSFVDNLLRDAKWINEKMESTGLDKEFADHYNELKKMIKIIEQTKGNVKKEVIIEAVTGVITLGTAVAGAVIGIIAIVGATSRAAGPAVSGTANVAKSAVPKVGKATAGATRAAVGAVKTGAALAATAEAEVVVPAALKNVKLIESIVSGSLNAGPVAAKVCSKITKNKTNTK